MTDLIEKDLCSQCNQPAVRYCRCCIGESSCANGHFWYRDSKGNRVEGKAHDEQGNYYEDADRCKQCREPAKYFCKCEIGESQCENGHKWYFNNNGDRIEGSAHH
jgi:hypothetical protein